jgi:peptide/nickel transport system substrate-binding protein
MDKFLKYVAAAGMTVALSGMLAADPAAAFERRGDKKILVYASRADFVALDPSIKYDAASRTFQRAIYDALVKYVGNPPKVIPWLAEQYEASDGGKTYTFHLVKNAKFHNGDPVTAEAVRWSFVRTLKIGKGPSWMLSDVLKPENIVAVDDHTVRITLDRPYAPFVTFLPWWFIMNPNQLMAHEVDGDMGQKWLVNNDAGGGPFKLVRVEPSRLWELDRVEDYWRGFKGELGGIIFKTIRESSVQRAALIKKELDIVTSLGPDEFEAISRRKGIKTSTEPALSAFGFKFNTRSKYLSDRNVRRAVSWAYDYDGLVKIYNGRAKLQTSPFNDAIQGKIDVPGIPRKDLAKAKAHLAKSKWPNGGFELEIVHVAGNKEQQQMALILIDSLKPLNIGVKVTPLPWSNMLARGSAPETSPDIMTVWVTPVSVDPDAVASQYHPKSWGRYWGTHWYDNPEVAKLVEEGVALTDWSKRAPIYEKIQKILVDDATEIFGMMRQRMVVYNDYVKGFDYSPVLMTDEIDLYQLYIE